VAQKLGFNSADVVFADGEVRSGNRSVPLAQAAGSDGLVAEDAMEYGDLAKKNQLSTFGAHFVEVGVNAATAEIRVRRMLAVCGAGRILNPKSARSQVIGAMTMGVGAALTSRSTSAWATSSTTTSPATRCRSMPTSRTRRWYSSKRPIRCRRR
jgi:xanthine dehydrogenase YagR molybdenum-binding subunit